MDSSFNPCRSNPYASLEKLFYQREWVGLKNFTHEFDYSNRQMFYDEVIDDLSHLQKTGYTIFKSTNKKDVYNIPCSFDIETSSFYMPANDRKAACMWIWQFGFNGSTIYGRTWDQFTNFIKEFGKLLKLQYNRLIYIYVHNLSYEFQWIKSRFEWHKVFALKKRKVARAVNYNLGIEFRCSYLLANASLAHVGEKMLTRYKIEKLVGTLDYSLVRSPETPVTRQDLDYSLTDVRVVMAFIQEKIENDGGITSIPLTNTGYVRQFCRNQCMSDKHASQKYHQLMSSLNIKSDEEYDQNKRAIMGGFTHTGILHANKILDNVGSADLISSYPAVMVSRYYPMSSATYIGAPSSETEFKDYLNRYCCIFDVEFTNLSPKVEYENYLSISKCIAEDYTLNNGRIVSAKSCICTLTEIDFDLVNKMYNWDEMSISNLRIYTRGYLPKSIIKAVLTLYSNKTKLKDVPGEEVEYLRSKGMANASFGMMLTDIIRPEYGLDEDDMWKSEEAIKSQQLNSYNKSFTRFLYYTWGIYVTAHARHNLFEAIMEFGEDYVYADTDSIKGLNFEKHLPFFTFYNFMNAHNMRKMCNAMGFDFDMVCPKTVYGEKKMLGDWEIEKSYLHFKAVGAKRYIYVYPPDKKHSEPWLWMTCAGVKKEEAVPYLLKINKGDWRGAMEDFEDGLVIPAGHTGKQTVTYIDKEISGYAYDYLGSRFEFHELSCVHMEPQLFSMSQTDEYLDLIKGVQRDELR